MIQLIETTKSFGSFVAVNRLSLEVKRGELYGFLGPNGAGKTTSIKMITGLFAPTSGRVLVNGFDIQKQPIQAKMKTGYVPDQPFLYEKLTGAEFLHFSAGLYRIPHDQTAKKILDTVKAMEIEPWMDRRIEDYSQGMRQRTAIASALLHEPNVLVIDEPMVGLDPRSAHLVKQVFRNLADNGCAVFMSTHSLAVAEELCDRIGILKNGELVFEGARPVLEEFKAKHDGKFESMFLELTK